jgi:hypothetical protein
MNNMTLSQKKLTVLWVIAGGILLAIASLGLFQ